MANYDNRAKAFGLQGVRLSRPVDLLGEEIFSPTLNKARSYTGFYAVVRNVRGIQDGSISPRPGTSLINSIAMTGIVHSLKELNDDVGPTLSPPTQDYAIFAGAGTKLYADNAAHNAYTEIASGLSGEQLTMIPHRPEQSPQPWMYIHDRNALLKAKASAAGDVVKSFQWGIDPPVTPLSIALASPLYKVIDNFEAGTFGGWAASAGTLTNEDRAAAVAISHILYDTGSTGWACVSPATMGEIREGMDITTSVNAETVQIDSVYKAITTTTIGSIRYDNAPTNTGLCTIQLASPTAELIMDSMVRIAAAENVRVLSVTYGPDGIPSFRCSTVSTRAAGDAVAGLATFRVYFANTHTTADTISGKMLKEITVAAPGITTLTRTLAIDLSTFTTTSRPVLPSDQMVISLTVDNPALITEIQIQLDVDASVNDFTKNYYFKSVNAADLTPLVQQTLTQLTIQQRVIQREQIRQAQRQYTRYGTENFASDDAIPDPDVLPDPTPGTDQTTTGATQWSVVRFPMSQLLRTGSDTSRGWKDIQKIRISINATAPVTVQVDDWYIIGGFGPDSVLPNSTDNGASPYYWIYRYRDSDTGAASAWSPINRSGFEVSRSRMVLTPVVSTDPQVDKIDYARIGGTLNVFRTIGTGPNSGSFNDDFPDDVIAAGGEPITEEDVLQIVQPFPVIDIPRTGTCDVKGTEVTWVSGQTFNIAAVQGALIIINNVPYHLYTNPTSTTQLSLSENAGTQTGVTFFIPDAALGGQTLDAVFGPYGGTDEMAIVFFGVRQGVLYWTMGNDPDRTRIDYQKEVTGGSEVLMNGVIWDSRPFLFSNLRVFEIAVETTIDANGVPLQIFAPKEIANSKGLYARYGLCSGAVMFFIGDDGVYACNGGQVKRISDNLGPLMPHDGVAGVPVNGINPPDFTQPDLMHLEFGDNEVKWSFIDTGGVYRTWVYDTIREGWPSLDTYAFRAAVHYHREKEGVHQELIGGIDGKVYLSDGALYQDNLVDYTSQVKTGAEDFGETRIQKQFGDVQVSTLTNGEDLTVVVYTENFENLIGTTVLNNAARTYEKVDIDSGRGVTATNIALDLSWTGNVILYEWNPSYLLRGDLAVRRATDWYAPNAGGANWLQGVKLDMDTFGVDKTFQVLGDDDVLIATIVCNHDGRVIKPYEWIPQITHLVRLLPVGVPNWLLYTEPGFVAEPDAELATIWQTQPTTFDWKAFGHVARVQIPHRSSSDITMTVTIDGVPQTYTISGGTAGEYQKTYVTLKAIKGKWFEFKFTAEDGARIYQRDVIVYGKPWGDTGEYQPLQPFGGPSRASGALI